MMRKRLFVWLLALTAVLSLTSCGLARLTGPPPLPAEMNIPHYFLRDIVRESAVMADGSPLFTKTDLDYGFTNDHFEMTGIYIAADGIERQGAMTLAFTVENGQLVAEIVDHNLELDTAELAALNESISTALEAHVAGKFEQEILSFEDVAVRDNDLLVALVHTGIDNVLPAN